MKKALIFKGGWAGHEPDLIAARFKRLLEQNGFAVSVVDGTEALADEAALLQYDLLVPCITMGEISREGIKAVSGAIAKGVGLAGCHGGMCDAFRQSTEWQFITGGQWVAHPGGDGVEYTVNIRRGISPITEGLEDFEVCSEQYYLHVDPAIEVLATTRFESLDQPIEMPVVWTKHWGKGRVYYCSLGHCDAMFDQFPVVSLLMERGMLWAAEGKLCAEEENKGV